MSSRHHNLVNKNSEPSKTPLMVTTSVHSPLIERVPKEKLEEWLASLPDGARITYEGIRSGKVYLAATWKENR